ncbi:tetratricopeptide repeat protein [Methanosarcina barkeri]
MMGEAEEAVSCYDYVLAINPNSPSALYNKRFALYTLKKLDEAAACKAKLDEIDPGFVDALQERGTKFFLPEYYNSILNYSLPSRWYGGEENVSGNVSTNTTAPSQSGKITEPSDSLENNSSNYDTTEFADGQESEDLTELDDEQESEDSELDNGQESEDSELDDEQESEDSDYWYVPEPDE